MTLPNVAYFSMEIAMDQSLSTYSGGLGFLAGSHMLISILKIISKNLGLEQSCCASGNEIINI